MPIFLLIRHGETDFNKKMLLPGHLPGIHLNKNGQRQAQVLAEALAAAPIKAIYSSPLERTLETAEPLARLLKLDIVPMPGLLEMDCGEWQGLSVKKLRRQKVWQPVQRQPSLFRFPGGESIFDCQVRMVQTIDTLRTTHPPTDLIACFSHADPIKEAVAFYLGLPLDHYQRLTLTPASVTALHIGENGSQLLMLNYNPSLTWDTFQPPKASKHKPGV